MELSKRLFTVANEVSLRSVADVGTDHAYIPIYLMENKKIDFAVAVDINIGPLRRAKENIKERGYFENIETRISDGLSNIEKNEAESLIIAGMGGMLICDILKKDIEKTKSFKELILQPQLDIPEVRKTLHSLGFKIENEIFTEDQKKYYTVIKCVHGEEKYENPLLYEYGKILTDKKDGLYKSYLLHELKKYEIIYDSLSENDIISESAIVRKNEISEKIENLKEVISWF